MALPIGRDSVIVGSLIGCDAIRHIVAVLARGESCRPAWILPAASFIMRVTAAADAKGRLAHGTGSAEWLNRHDSDVFSGRVFEQYSYVGHGFLHAVIKNWRASPHCRLVNLVRSGRKQPQPITASAGGKARLLLWCRQSVIECLSRLLFLPLAGGSWIGGRSHWRESDEKNRFADKRAAL